MKTRLDDTFLNLQSNAKYKSCWLKCEIMSICMIYDKHNKKGGKIILSVF